MARKQVRRVSDERWALALDRVDKGDLREFVRALLVIAPVPEWVREDYESPNLSVQDQLLLNIVADYRKQTGRVKNRDFAIRRLMKKYGVSEDKLLSRVKSVLDCKGRIYKRLQPHLTKRRATP